MVDLGAPPSAQHSLCGISHNETPSKGCHPRSRFSSDSRGWLSLTCVVSLKSCHLTAPGPRHLIRLMPDA